MNRRFWDGRRVLITGHSGFKGAWLTLWLADRGAEITGYSRGRPTDPCASALLRSDELARSVEGDIADVVTLSEVVGQAAPEIVFHLAAQPIVGRSYASPYATFETNVMGTVSVLEAVRRRAGARVVINVTSDKCYEDRGWVWPYRERDRLGGHDPYSSSKACAELVTSAFRESLLPDVAVASARAGNVFGGGDFAPDRLVPDAMRAADCGQRLGVRNPSARRPWQHVLNALAGYVTLAERLWEDGSLAGAWNFGPAPDDFRPVAWIADCLAGLSNGLEWDVASDPDAARETHALSVDSSKAHALLGWRPVWDLETGLARTVEWHRALAEAKDMRELTRGQLAQFEADAAA